MKTSAIVLTIALLGGTALQPAHAAGLLSGASGAVNSTVGSSGPAGGAGVSGVATVNSASDGAGTRVTGTVLGGGGSTINAGLGSLIGGNSNAAVVLPGTGESTLDAAVGDAADSVNGVTENGGGVTTVLGDTGLTGSQGGVGGALGGNGGLLGTDDNTGDGGLGSGGISNGSGLGSGSAANTNGLNGGNMAGLFGAGADSPACRQNTGTLVQLLRTPYSVNTAARWAQASAVQVVKVPVCVQIKGALGRALANNANISHMQEMATADPLISASLARSRVAAGHVLGVGQGRNGVTVYVY